MKKYRKKPVVIEAIQLKVDNFDVVCDFMSCTPIVKYNPNYGIGDEPYLIGVYIETLEGSMLANYDDYIIKGINGEFYPCKREIFEKTYGIDNGTDDISDGYHTFKELYQYRLLYNAAFFNEFSKKGDTCKSRRHHDGELCFGGGWFTVMAELPTGQISNHYADKDWDLFNIPELDTAWEWDGHTPNGASGRLKQYLSYNAPMNFGDAIEVLKQGGAIRRKGWNGKGLFVVKQIPAHITEEIIPKMQSLPQSAKDIIMSRENKVLDYTNQMLIINQEGRADSWVPSASDVFAEDWEIIID